MNLKATIAGAIGVTAITGTLLFKTDIAQDVWNNILELKSKIEAFADNEKKLVDKYYDLKEDAQDRIAELEKELEELENNSNTSASEKAELEKQINIANKAIEDLKIESDKIVADTEKLEPTKPEDLPSLDLATADAHFYSGHTQVDITLKENINIAPFTSDGNVIIEFYKDGAAKPEVTKEKVWYDGYLNDPERNKYGKGIKNVAGYSNDLRAGVKYTTTLDKVDGITKVIVKVINNDKTNTQEIVLTK